MRAIYEDCYRRILRHCSPGGPTLEIGGGIGNLKAFHADAISSDIQWAPWLDVVTDAHSLPFPAASFRNLMLFDVLHHLERPRLFLEEAARVLLRGGRLVVCEPAITPLSYLFYRFLHPEPVRLGDDPLTERAFSGERDPYAANQAIPTRLFGRDRARLESLVPSLAVVSYERFSFFAYPLSGGFGPWSALPASLAGPLLRLEHRLESLLGPVMAFRLLAALERR